MHLVVAEPRHSHIEADLNQRRWSSVVRCTWSRIACFMLPARRGSKRTAIVLLTTHRQPLYSQSLQVRLNTFARCHLWHLQSTVLASLGCQRRLTCGVQLKQGSPAIPPVVITLAPVAIPASSSRLPFHVSFSLCCILLSPIWATIVICPNVLPQTTPYLLSFIAHK